MIDDNGGLRLYGTRKGTGYNTHPNLFFGSDFLERRGFETVDDYLRCEDHSESVDPQCPICRANRIQKLS